MIDWQKKMIVLFSALSAGLFLFLFWRTDSRLWLAIEILLFFAVLFLLNWWQNHRQGKGLFARLPFVIGNAGAILMLFSIVEDSSLQIMLIFLSMLMAGFACWLPDLTALPPHQRQPLRRLLMAFSSFIIFCCFSGIYALGVFFPELPFWLLIILPALLSGFIAREGWHLYFDWPREKFRLALWITVLLFWEIVWSIHFLPIGYLIQGLVATWLWYLTYLLIRFNFSPESIIWKKQWRFVLINFLFLALILFFYVRWI